MTDLEWKELESEGDRTPRGKELLAQTEGLEEHPDEYNGPCLCNLCMSYAD